MHNIIKTLILLGVLSVLLVFVGGLLGGRDGIYTAFFLSIVMNAGAYFFSDKLALSMNGAQPLKEHSHPEVYAIIEKLAKKMHIPLPKLYLLPSPQANAFATGRSPSHASVAITEGILRLLTKDELEAVLAHELGHVQNRDILIASVAAVLASSISFLANMSIWGGHRNDEDRSRGAMGLLLALLVPIAASIIQLALSREREFAADETGAKIVGDGNPLARALVKIHDSTRRVPMNINPAFSSLYIDNPLGNVGGTLLNLFSTHPPVEERIKRLHKI